MIRHWQISKSTLKLWKILFILLGSLFALLYLIPLACFQIPYIQREAGRVASRQLSELLGTRVSVDRVGLTPWTALEVENIEISDSLDLPLLSAHRLLADYNLIDLISGQGLYISTIRLFEPRLQLRSDSTGRLNAQHILDHLASGDDSSGALHLAIHSILIQEALLSLDKGSTHVVSLRHFSTKISRLSLGEGYVQGAINKLSFETSSGFELSRLSSQIQMRGDSLKLFNTQIHLPNSYLSLPLIELDLSHPRLGVIKDIQIASSHLSSSDFSELYNPISEIEQTLQLQGRLLSRDKQSLSAELNLVSPTMLSITSTATLRLDSLGVAQQIHLQLSDLQTNHKLLEVLRPLVTPELFIQINPWVSPLGSIHYSGELDYQSGATLKSIGRLSTTLGSLSLELQALHHSGKWQELTGKLRTDRLDLSPLPITPTKLGQVQLAIELQALRKQAQGKIWSVRAHTSIPSIQIDGHTYTNLEATLSPQDNNRYTLESSLRDASIHWHLLARAQWREGEPREIEAHVTADHLNLATLGVGAPLGRTYSLEAHTTLNRLSLSTTSAHISLPYLRFSDTDGEHTLTHLNVDLQPLGEGSRVLQIQAPWMQASLEGQFDLVSLPQQVYRALQSKIPALSELPRLSQTSQSKTADLRLTMTHLPSAIPHLLSIPLDIPQPLALQGHYRASGDNPISLKLQADSLTYAGHTVHSLRASIEGDHLSLSSDIVPNSGAKYLGAKLDFSTRPDSLRLHLNLGKDGDGRENGAIAISAQIHSISSNRGEKGLALSADLSPSTLRIHNQLWQLSPAHLYLDPDKLEIDRLRLATEGRELLVSGRLASEAQDALQLHLQNINLRYILEAAGVDFDLIDTDLSGDIQAQRMGKTFYATAEVNSPHFYVSGKDVGEIDTRLSWDSQRLNIELDGQVYQPDGGRSSVVGFIRPADGAGLDLRFSAKKLQTEFISGFTESFLEHISGKATGQIRLFGFFEDGVSIEGDIDVVDGQIGVEALGTRYYFNDKIHFEPELMKFDHITMRDDEGHTGILNGTIKHEYFDHWNLDLNATQIQSLKVLNTTRPRSLPAFGRAYGSGHASLKGTSDALLLDVSMRSEPGTELSLDFKGGQVEREEGFIHFRNLRDSLDTLSTTDTVPTTKPSRFDIHLDVEVTPSALFTMRLEGDGGSLLQGRVEGKLQIELPASAASNVYGALAVQEGHYTFRLQQLSIKKFQLQEGGRIIFRGDPLSAQLNLSAAYSLSANIADLDESLAEETKRTNVPVQCLVFLEGNILHPSIKFDLELPGAESELQRRVHALLSREESIQKQIIYLIALGKFYTADLASPRTTANSSNNWTAIASSTLSEQLSNLLGGVTNRMTFGTNIKTSNTDFDDTDVELLFSGSWFDSRLLLTGNLGYHDNPYLRNAYIGEFDLEYKLNRMGSLRLKAYNHHNNMYQYLRQSLTTQGLGILFRQRFDRLRDILHPARRVAQTNFTLPPIPSLSERDSLISP